jgi:hypothetical protein
MPHLYLCPVRDPHLSAIDHIVITVLASSQYRDEEQQQQLETLVAVVLMLATSDAAPTSLTPMHETMSPLMAGVR